MENKLVSIIIPVYNGAKYLRQAIESAMKQSYKNIEVIVVDDGSTDNSSEIAKCYDVKYLYQQNQGPSAARNNGIIASAGEYIAFLDCDDVYFHD
jgi:glycosyltransferase involved in cell wall biosynthesis